MDPLHGAAERLDAGAAAGLTSPCSEASVLRDRRRRSGRYGAEVEAPGGECPSRELGDGWDCFQSSDTWLASSGALLPGEE